MLDALISSKTRIKLLLKFFLNSNTSAYLRHLEKEFGESTNSIRLELDRFEAAGMLTARNEGNKKFFRANTEHPLFNEVHNIIRKYVGIDRVIEYIIERLGNVENVYLTGSFSKGLDSSVIDLIIIGEIDKKYLTELVEKAEALINRKVRYLIFDTDKEFQAMNHHPQDNPPLLIWSK